jgi:hypothetical protein
MAWLAPVLGAAAALVLGWRREVAANPAEFAAVAAYWAMPGLVAVGFCTGFLVRRAPAPGGTRGTWLGFCAAAALALLAATLAPPTQRMQFDETSLAGTALDMHRHRAATMTTAAVPFEGAAAAVERTQDKRPPLWPFLASVVHDLTGPRPGNGFAVNLLLFAGLLWLVHRWLTPTLGPVGAVSGPLLVLACPAVVLAATSGGFELLALVLLGTVLTLARAHLAAPSPARAAHLMAWVGLAAASRYETGPLALWVAGPVWWWTRRVPGVVRAVVGTGGLLLPLLVPLGWLASHAQRADFHPEAAGRPTVAFGHVVANLPPLLHGLFVAGGPWPIALPWLGAVGWLVRWRRRRVGRLDGLVVGTVGAATGIVLLWFFGDVRDPGAVRLYLPVALLGTLAPLLWAPMLPQRWRTAVVLALAAGCAFWRGVDFAAGRLAQPQATAAAVAEVVAVARRHQAPGTLWVTFAAQALVVEGWAAMPPAAFARHAAEVRDLRRRGEVQQVLVLETPWDAAFAPAFGGVAELLAPGLATVAARRDGPLPVTVWRLRS